MKIGILGGGQLSRMLILAGLPLGFDFVCYEPTPTCCVDLMCKTIHADYTDQTALQTFAQQVDVITFENENIPPATLEFLATQKPVYPDAKAIAVSQHRLLEKNLFGKLTIATNQYQAVNNKEDLASAIKQLGYPLMLKKCRGGYDGRGQIKITDPAAYENLTDPALFSDAIAEQYVHFDREVSLVAARNTSGDIVYYDLSENVHKDGILIRSRNKPDDPFFAQAQNYLAKIMTHLNYVGTLAVEFFQAGDKLLANEMAPRVHNSGHWTIEGAVTSQFENHIRAIAGLPLGATGSVGYATMYNIIGTMPDKVQLLKQAGLHLHDYQKAPRPARKIGHATLVTLDHHTPINSLADFF